MESRPKFVAISDLHFRVSTLELASKALQSAIDKARELNVPLIIAGDLIDSKSIIPAEVANKLIELLDQHAVQVYLLVGNHDLINEKGQQNSLNFLAHCVHLISAPIKWHDNIVFIPYVSNKDALSEYLKTVPLGSTLFMHQGFLGAMMGDYIQDKSSISVDAVKDFRVITGHYHKHQTIGTVTYIGSPYTITFTEANDGPKGYLVVNEDGSFTREILDLRRHIILDQRFDALLPIDARPEDLVWLKIRGPLSELQKINKSQFSHSNLKLDLIPDAAELVEKSSEVQEPQSAVELLDSIIDNSGDTQEQNDYLRRLYRALIDSEN